MSRRKYFFNLWIRVDGVRSLFLKLYTIRDTKGRRFGIVSSKYRETSTAQNDGRTCKQCSELTETYRDEEIPTICLTWIQRRLPALMEFLDKFYRNAVPSLLCLLFNHSLSSGTVPSEWKSADVSPIHKKDNKEPASNHRPISLLPTISKVLKRCVCNRFYEHVRDMISKAQHVFLNGRSCVTQLL